MWVIMDGMMVVVIISIKRQGTARPSSKQLAIGLGRTYYLGRAFTANVPFR
jgi:hypothetical protein